MTQQTAVEWLEEHLKKQGFLYDLDIIAAKQMEKEQIIEAYIDASEKLEDITKEAAEEYYIKTYGRKSEILITKSENK